VTTFEGGEEYKYYSYTQVWKSRVKQGCWPLHTLSVRSCAILEYYTQDGGREIAGLIPMDRQAARDKDSAIQYSVPTLLSIRVIAVTES